ncbi:MAG TPA: SOS response-associated peptidase [Thermoanaerobaculia bacterium]|nr:SOS response-associated peptidase [Thermoanaerobaculia bacterium]
MCGRYTLSSPIEVVSELFDLVPGPGGQALPPLLPRYNLAPTQEAAVVRVVAPGAPRSLDLLRWGLIPYWAKEAAIGNRMINARAESVAEKPAFRFSFRKKRCLVVADGFYEWKREGREKQPCLIRRHDRHPFAFAGLWSSWRDPEGNALDTFTILTTDANDFIRPLHDRMPVILGRDSYDLWLDPAVEDPARLMPLLAPAPSEGFETVRVSKAVNSPAHDAADCIEPLAG